MSIFHWLFWRLRVSESLRFVPFYAIADNDNAFSWGAELRGHRVMMQRRAK